jgi:hypothetical protein
MRIPILMRKNVYPCPELILFLNKIKFLFLYFFSRKVINNYRSFEKYGIIEDDEKKNFF